MHLRSGSGFVAFILTLALLLSMPPFSVFMGVAEENASDIVTAEQTIGQETPDAGNDEDTSAQVTQTGLQKTFDAGEGGNGSVSIEKIENQEARIVVAAPDSEGVDWGSEPLVLTVRTEPVGAALDIQIEHPELLTAEVTGINDNVLILTPKDIAGLTNVTVTARSGSESASTTFSVMINKYEDTGEYEWGTMQIPGGGFVTGYVFHPAVPDIMYARTDVGGTWRFNFETKKWELMCVSSNNGSPSLLGIAIDPDPNRANLVYAIASNRLLRSEDYGHTWVYVSSGSGTGSVGMGTNANSDGRGCGEKLIVLPGDGKTMFAGGGNAGGLRRSTDGGVTWSGVTLTHGQGRNPNTNETSISFVNYDPNHPNFIIVGTAGANGNPDNNARLRGPSVFYSDNGGATFQELPDQPKAGMVTTTNDTYYGYVGYRSAFSFEEDDHYLFITYSEPRHWTNDVNSGLGMEGAGVDGCLYRWELDGDGKLKNGGVSENITPVRVVDTYVKGAAATDRSDENIGGTVYRNMGVGVSGVSVDPQIPGAMICATHNSDFNDPNPLKYHRSMDSIFRSLDYGETWFPVLTGYNMYGDLQFGEKAPYLRPLVNGTHYNDGVNDWWEPWSILHWNTAPTINPFDSDMLIGNTGVGAFVTYNLTALDKINKAEPHAVSPISYAGTTGEKALFKTVDGVITDLVESNYTPYRIGNAINNLTAEQSVKWEHTQGLEMTAHIGGNLISPTSGDVIAMTSMRDYGGFAFTSLTDMPSNAFSFERPIPAGYPEAEEGEYFPVQRWITGNNSDFAALNPDVMVATVSGDWHFNSTTGVIITFDNAKSWHQLPDGWIPTRGLGGAYWKLGSGNGMPTEALQKAVNDSKSTTDSPLGYVTISADSKAILWVVGSSNIQNVVRTDDYGENWTQPTFYNASGNVITTGTLSRIYADRVNPNVIYAFSNNNSTVYVSRDKGVTFRPIALTNAPGTSVGNVGSNVRVEAGKEGVIWASAGGLHRIEYKYNEEDGTSTMVATAVQSIGNPSRYGQGLGVNANPDNKAIYVYGTRSGTGQQSGPGVWRSLDGGETWRKITISTDTPSRNGTAASPFTDENKALANPAGIEGDPRVFGRVYHSGCPGGVSYGEMVTRLIESGAKTALKTLIDQAEALVEEDYEPESWAKLEQALDEAKRVNADEGATQDEIVAAVEALRKAIDDLEEFIEVTSVKIDGAAIQQLRIRNTKQFNATVNPTNATDPSLTWESSNEKIFTVDENGLVKGVGTGSAKLIITAGNGKTSFIMVQITA